MQDEPVGVTAAHTPQSTEDEHRSRPASQPEQSLRGAFTQDYCLNPHEPQSGCDLEPGREVHQLLGQRAQAPPPRGHFSHLQLRADPSNSAVGEEADAASPSPPSVNPHQLQMDPRLAPHLNNGNGSSMLSGAAFPNLPAQEMQSGGFGTPWSVQSSSPPPPVANSINPIQQSAIKQVPSAESENSFYPGVPSMSPAFFHSFSPLAANPCAEINVQGFSGSFSPQINVPQQPQSRRSPVSPQMPPHHGALLQQRNSYNQQQVSGARMKNMNNVQLSFSH